VTQAQTGFFVTTGGGGSTLNGWENTGGASTQKNNIVGSYGVSSNGRVILTGSGIASPDPVLYLVNANEAFIVGADTGVTFGFMESQSGAPFSSLNGQYAGGSVPAVLSPANDQIDITVADGMGNLSFTTDVTNGTGLTQGQTSTATCTLDSTGQCTLMESGNTIGYIFAVSPTEFYQLYIDPNVTLEHFQQ